MAAADYVAVVQQLYVSYFGRPADYYGLQNFTAQLDALKAPTDFEALNTAVQADKAGTTALAKLVNSFNASAESAALYGTDNTTIGVSKFVAAIYQNVLGREADVEGLNFWVSNILNGTLTRQNVAMSITQAATENTSAQGLLDAKTVANKLTVASNFTDALDTVSEINGYSGDAAAGQARGLLSQVKDTTDPVAFQSTVDATIASIVDHSQPSQSFNLTNSTDILTGGNGNDVFTSAPTVVIDPATGNQSVVDTLQIVDKLDGGAGNDKLVVTVGNAATNAKPTLTNIETVSATFNAAGTIDLSASKGVTSVVIDGGSAASKVLGIGAAAVTVQNTSAAATFDGSTADNLSITATTVGKSSALTKIDTGAVAASKATAVTVNATNAFINLDDTVGNTGIVSATINATGKNAVKFTDAAGTLTSLTVTGAGSVDVSGAALTTLKTLTAGDGGVKVDATGGVLKTVTTGAGADTITAVGATVGTFATGAGNDKVSVVTTALAATSSIDLGDGDDTLVLGVAPTAGATLTGGAGTDTISVAAADFTTISGFTAANLAKITGFEVLSITGAALADLSTFNLSAIAGLTSFQTLGVATGKSATVTNVGANASINLVGDTATNNGTLNVTLKDNTATSDVLNITIKQDITDDADGSANSVGTGAAKIVTAGVETINVTSTHTLLNAGAGDDLDFATNTLTLTDDALVTLNVTGGSAFAFASAVAMTKLATIDASANTAGTNINASNAAADAAVTIKGSATAANVLVGGAAGDTIVGGAKADTITGGAGGDTLTGGAGNDTFVYAAGQSSIGTGTFDTITDFSANTSGNGTTVTAANTTASKWTGDVLAFTHTGTAVAANGFKVFVAGSAADATTFLANTASASNAQASAALDSTSNNLYVDVSGDGVADFYIHLTGVSTITAAAFTLA